MEKIKNIEFLRVFLICCIVGLHMFIDRKWCLCTLFPDISLYQNLKTAIAHSNNCVEGFFIIAGFLLVLTFKPDIKIKDFIIKKYIRLSPVILFSMILCFVGFLLGAMKFSWIPNILTVLLVNQFGIKIVVGENPVLWYTSSLFVGLLLYFCIIKYLPNKIKYISISFLIILSYTIVEILQHGSFANPLKNYYGIFNIGFLRGIGGIGLGCIVGGLYKYFLTNIKSMSENIFSKILFTLTEISLMLFIVWWCIGVHTRINNIIFVLAFCLLFVLFILRKGYLSSVLNGDIWVKLGKFQYSIYVVHYVIIRIIGIKVWKHFPEIAYANPYIPIIITLFTVLIIGVLTYYMVELPCAKFLKHKLMGKK